MTAFKPVDLTGLLGTIRKLVVAVLAAQEAEIKNQTERLNTMCEFARHLEGDHE